MPFDQPTRNLLARFVGDARALLTDEFTRQLQQEYGLDPERGEETDLSRLGHLDDARRATALLLRETLAYYLAGQPKPDAKARREALDRIVREQAFTILNRLCALRMAEGRGLLIESVGRDHRSQGFQLYVHLAGTGLGETGDAYRCYLFSLFDELALELPVLFDRYAPEGRLFPREAALLDVLALINEPEIAPLWAEDETIGWIYQYFNSAEERRQMRAESGAPRNSRELAVRNQFFTPRYVVEFLTDNTLGRIWYEMTKGETSLAETCQYLVRRPTEIFLAEGEEAPQQDQPAGDLSQEELLRQPVYIPHRPLKDPRDILMLDPACGSLHFGLYAFDLYERIYDEAWELEGTLGPAAFLRSDGLLSLRETYRDKAAFLRDVPRLIIERNIHGIDIDPRAVQIAGLSLWLRAQRSWQAQGIKPQDRPQIRRSNIVCAEPMPGDRALLEEFLRALRDERLEGLIRRVLKTPANQRVRATPSMADALCDLVRTVWKEMELAGEAGSLLKIEEALAGAVARGRAEWDEKMPLFRVVEFGLTEQADSKPTIRYYKTIPGKEDSDFWDRAEALVMAALEEYAERAENGGAYRRHLFAGDAVRGFAFIDLCRKRYDVVLMNPPFGEPAGGSKDYVQRHFPNGSADILQAFVERGLAWIRDQGREGAISARTGFFLGASTDWRANVVFVHRVACFADLGLGVLDDALVEVAAYVIERGAPNGVQILTNRQLDTREKGEGLLRAVEATSKSGEGGFDVFDQSLLQLIPDLTFAYWAPASLLRRYSDRSSFGKSIGRVRQGVATADDFRFARLAWEVAPEEIGLEKRWRRFSKGGEYSPPYDDIHLLVDWLRDGAQLAASPSARFQNVERMFRPGATYTVRTASAFAGKILPADCVFSHNAQTWFAESNDVMLLSIGYLSCRVPQTYLELAVGSGDIATAGSAARRYTTAVVESVPAEALAQVRTSTNVRRVQSVLSFRLREFMADETSCHFASFHSARAAQTIAAAVNNQLQCYIAAAVESLRESAALDTAICNAFNLTDDERRFVDGEVGVHPVSYSGTADSDEIFRLFHLSEEALMAEAIARHGSKRWFTKKSYFVDRRLEIICHQLEIAPTCVELALREHQLVLRLDEYASSFLSESLGCILGRWDVRLTSTTPDPDVSEPFAPLPACPPGMLRNAAGLPAAPGEALRNYPLRISWLGVIVDDEGHPEDIERRVREAIRVISGQRADTIEAEACQILNVRTLREYFRKPTLFFADHLKRYSKSRRQAPIYWPLSTPSGTYTLWLYYHRLSDQTLYTCVNDFVDPKLKQVSDDAGRLRQKRGRSSAEEKALEQLAGLELELTDFRAELLRIAAFWKPNLNDGVQITAAPLWRLFQHRPWQKTIKETWESLERGEYDWAHLAMSIWPERVVPKCVTDRSLAIAHDVEDLFWVEDGGRWRNLNPPDEELAEQVRRQQRPGRDQLRSGLAALTLGEGRGLRCEQVYEALATGKWDDLTTALLLWPERVAQKCWDDPLLAVTLKIDLPTKRTKAARERFIAERMAAGCPDLADALREALADRVDRFASLWAELARGDRDELALALALWPDRVVDKCAKDVELAERYGLRRFLWVQDRKGGWRHRRDLGQEIEGEIRRRAT